MLGGKLRKHGAMAHIKDTNKSGFDTLPVEISQTGWVVATWPQHLNRISKPVAYDRSKLGIIVPAHAAANKKEA